jgi:hypothetical protein
MTSQIDNEINLDHLKMDLAFHSDKSIPFGVLKLGIPPVGQVGQVGAAGDLGAVGNIISTQHIVLFNIDISGSMDDHCADGRTKMQHAIHTTKNIWKMLAEKTNIIASLNAFDDKVDEIISPEFITNENMILSLQKINNLLPRNSTNIELALVKINSQIYDMLDKYPDASITHILLTDGNATAGCRDPLILSTLVNTKIMNVFIGYGIDHSAQMLSTLGNCLNANYYFIDQIEKGGLVLGEIYNSIFNKRYSNVIIQGLGLEFYNFRNNIWYPTLNIDYLISETERTFHVRFNPEKQEFILENGTLLTISGLDILTNINGTLSMFNTKNAKHSDLQKYIFRQRTQEFMFRAQNENDNLSIKEDLKALLTEIKTYMETHLLLEDTFYVSLCDDLAITIRTYGTEHGFMYAAGRINSNGNERAYNICSIPPSNTHRQQVGHFRSVGISQHVRAMRGNSVAAGAGALDNDDSQEEDIGHTITQTNINSTNVTPSMSKAMRNASLPW